MLTQQCGKCLRWCCPECYVPWTALACGACRAEARAAAADPSALPSVPPVASVPPAPITGPGCRDRSRTRGAPGLPRHRERTDVHTLAARVADLERRLQELRPGG